MRRAAPSLRQHLPSVSRRARALAVWFALAGGACSVYTSDLLQEATSTVSNGGMTPTAGKPSNVAGTTVTMGGTSGGDTPGTSGGDGGSDGGEPAGGAPQSNAGAGGAAAGTEAGGTGGTGGNAGSTSGGMAGANTEGPIDTFEDQNIFLSQFDGRGGVWYLVGDGTTGTVAPTPLVVTANSGAPAALGDYAMHVTATGWTTNGSVLGTDFRDQKAVYDASRFVGIRFWAKVAAGKNAAHRMQISDSTTDQAAGNCVPGSTVKAEKCDDNFGSALTLTTTWTQYSITFKQMTQGGWGKSAPAITKAALYGLQFTAKVNVNVDLWVDQIEFY